MRISRIKFLLFLVIALLSTPVGVQANNGWDFVYGDDPSNGNNVSAYMDIKVDPLGGTFLIGYFYGTYEGLTSGSSYGLFVQHRAETGAVDWTRQYGSFPSNLTPGKWFDATVDGAGTLFINQFPTNNPLQVGNEEIHNGIWHSITRSGVVVSEGSSSRCTRGVGAAEGGVVRLCDTSTLPWAQGRSTSQALEKVSSSFSRVWQSDVTSFMDGMCTRNETANGYSAGGCETLLSGANGSVWLIDGLNVNNFATNQTTLPQGLRSATGMSQWNTTSGTRTNSIKHYGMLPLKALSISDRSLWLAVRTLDPSACYLNEIANCAEEIPNASFDSATGALRGYFGNKFNIFPRFLRATLANDGYQYLFQNGITTTNLQTVGTFSPEWCLLKAFTWTSVSWIGADRQDFQGMDSSACPSGSHWSTFITNDGRRLALVVSKKLVIWEINEDSNGVPRLGNIVSRKTFQSTIQGIDADILGNIYVVGSTYESVLVASSTESIRPQASLASTRAFVARNPSGRIGLDLLPRTPLRFKVTGANGVPGSGVGAVSMNVTVTSPDAEGFITVYPCDTRPDASNLNYVLNQTVPNAVIAPVSANGEVCFYTYARTHLIADVNGYFPTGSGFVSNTPARVIDTRVGSAQGLRTVSKTKVGNGTELRVQFTNLPGGITPASGVGAVSLNVTVTGSRAPDEGGFVTVYPCGSRPDASNLNFRTGQTVPNAVISPVSANGEVCFYVFGSTDLIADINGYFPSGSGFVATEPVRVADTRAGSAQGLRTVTKQRIGGNTTLQLQLTNLPGGVTPASGIGAVSLNVTAVNTTANQYGGYVTTYPCGTIPDVSSLNFVSNQIVPNAVIAPLSANGTICFYAYGETDLIVDLNGYFPTGAGFVPVSPKRMFDTR